MLPTAALTQLGKLIAADLARGDFSGGLRDVGEALAASPDSILVVLDLLAKESRKKKRNHGLIEAFGFMVGQALETLRFGVERNYAGAVAAVAAVREKVLALATEGKVDPGTLLLILRQFASAKVEPGDDLQTAMAGIVDSEPSPAMPTADIGHALAEMAGAFDGDMFAFQAQLAEQAAALPDSHRAGIVAALLAAPDLLLREVAIGWLLDPGTVTREDVSGLLWQAAAAGHVSPVMLRRLITIRNWLPEKDRANVDDIVRACRRKSIECAMAVPSETRGVVATGIDGSGAQSLFVMVKDGRKQAAAALLLKQGAGVRDAWVNTGLTKREAEMFLYRVETEADCFDSSVGFVRLALGHALATGRVSGSLPPFGLVDVVERAGLADINPAPIPVEALVARLVDDIAANRRAARMVSMALKGSAAWEDDFLFMDSWFEDDGDLDALLGGKRLSGKRRAALVLDIYLPTRRSHWAGLLAWTAATLREDESTEDNWIDFALAARELLGDRPLAEIPLMAAVAKRSVDAWRERRMFAAEVL